MTLDGKIATRSGDSKWVTSEASRRMVHALRNEVDAIFVPVGGGGLIAGACLAAPPEVAIVGVEPFGCDSMGQSIALGQVVPVDPLTLPEPDGADVLAHAAKSEAESAAIWKRHEAGAVGDIRN